MNNKIRALSRTRENAYGIDDNGKKVVVIERFPGQESTETCPFCGDKHIHGKTEGHRIPHCNGNDYEYVAGPNVVFKNKEGELFDLRTGTT